MPTLTSPAELYDPNDTILLVVDKQRFYADPTISPFFGFDADPRWSADVVTAQDDLIAVARAAGG